MTADIDLSKILCRVSDGEKSPSGKYNVSIAYYNEKSLKYWDNTRASIINTNTGREVISIDRNYSSFFHSWVIYRGKEYLMCSCHYHGGETCVDPELKEIYNFTPLMCDEYVPYFCFSGPWHVSPDEKTLAVAGCYWGGPYEIQFYDISDGIEKVPYIRLPTLFQGEEIYIPDGESSGSHYNDIIYEYFEAIYGPDFDLDDTLNNQYKSMIESNMDGPHSWNSDGTYGKYKIYRDGSRIICPNGLS